MSWERRLREMVLAGGAGALAAVGCVGGSIAGGDSGSDGDIGPGVNFCCNANSDPCCPSLNCGATVTVQCSEKMACEADGGTWDYGAQGCARPEDSGPADALPDAVTYPNVSFCCNANSDPCCPSLYCGATATVECVEKLACEADGGAWDYGQGCALDAGLRDATPNAPDAGPSDAGVDGHGQSD